jgi:hypothetical protein
MGAVVIILTTNLLGLVRIGGCPSSLQLVRVLDIRQLGLANRFLVLVSTPGWNLLAILGRLSSSILELLGKLLKVLPSRLDLGLKSHDFALSLGCCSHLLELDPVMFLLDQLHEVPVSDLRHESVPLLVLKLSDTSNNLFIRGREVGIDQEGLDVRRVLTALVEL